MTIDNTLYRGRPAGERIPKEMRCYDLLDELGIEADLILFHPYDRWGFAKLSREESLIYLRYMIHRYAAFRNIWWSLANEYDLMEKSQEEWDEIGEILAAEDPFHHLISAHHCLIPFPKRDWMTHCSLQMQDPSELLSYRVRYGLPVIDDECGYEGDIEFFWGNIPGDNGRLRAQRREGSFSENAFRPRTGFTRLRDVPSKG